MTSSRALRTEPVVFDHTVNTFRIRAFISYKQFYLSWFAYPVFIAWIYCNECPIAFSTAINETITSTVALPPVTKK